MIAAPASRYADFNPWSLRHLIRQKRTLQRWLSWTTQVGPKCHHKCPCKREAAVDLTTEVEMT